jgi:ligand-binding sensor domain-containing protein
MFLRLQVGMILLLFNHCAFAQKPSLYFERLTTQNGLSNNKVNCFIQDQRGFMWIGTNDGLNRYDGQYFTIFRKQQDNGSGLSGNIITDLVEDKKEILWIATADGGLTKYDYHQPPAINSGNTSTRFPIATPFLTISSPACCWMQKVICG